LRKEEKKNEKRKCKMLAAAAKDVEEAAKQAGSDVEEASKTHESTPVKSSKKSSRYVQEATETHETTPEKANMSDETTPVKSSKKSKMQPMPEDGNKENTKVKKQLGANELRGGPVSATEHTETEASLMKQLRPRARSALKRLLEQERGKSEQRAKADVIAKAKEEEALDAEMEAAKARKEAKWEAKQEAAKVAAMNEAKTKAVEGSEASAAAEEAEDVAELQALVKEAEAAAAAFTKNKPVLSDDASSSNRLGSSNHVAPAATVVAESDLGDDIDLAEWEIV